MVNGYYECVAVIFRIPLYTLTSFPLTMRESGSAFMSQYLVVMVLGRAYSQKIVQSFRVPRKYGFTTTHLGM